MSDRTAPPRWISDPQAYECPVEITVKTIGGKWKPLILHHLSERGTTRFGELKRLLRGVTQRSLTLQLRELERDGLVERRAFGEVPPRVEYSMSDFGRTLCPLLDAMCEWGVAFAERNGGMSAAFARNDKPAPDACRR